MRTHEAKTTQQFLRAISRRLSGRPEFVGISYIVGIGCPIPGMQLSLENLEDPSKYVYFYPDIYVYRDKHHRKDSDRFKIVELVLNKFFPELISGKDEYGQTTVNTDELIKGVYEYQPSVDKKRRRWIRYDSNRYNH